MQQSDQACRLVALHNVFYYSLSNFLVSVHHQQRGEDHIYSVSKNQSARESPILHHFSAKNYFKSLVVIW